MTGTDVRAICGVRPCNATNGYSDDKISAAHRAGAVIGETAVTPFRIFVSYPEWYCDVTPAYGLGKRYFYNAARWAKKFNQVIGLVIYAYPVLVQRRFEATICDLKLEVPIWHLKIGHPDPAIS